MSLTTLQASLKMGDLVRWHTNAWVFKDAAKNYKNPGIILEKKDKKGCQDAYRVMWADGRVTDEWAGYLHIITNKEE